MKITVGGARAQETTALTIELANGVKYALVEAPPDDLSMRLRGIHISRQGYDRFKRPLEHTINVPEGGWVVVI